MLTPTRSVKIVETVIELNNGKGHADDIDHLGNRRVRTVGELIQKQFRVGLLRMERVVKERMSLQDPETATPNALINIRPVVAAMREFFGGSQLSQFMDQTNPLAELTNKRRLSALGPGGLSRDRAGFEVRDVHHSHYGRICPVETPEGPNIGLIGTLSTFARDQRDGLPGDALPQGRSTPSATNCCDERPAHGRRSLRERASTPSGKVIAARPDCARCRPRTLIAERQEPHAGRAIWSPIKIRPIVSRRSITCRPTRRKVHHRAGQRAARRAQPLLEERVIAPLRRDFVSEPIDRVDYMDVSPKQVVSVSTALIPFLEHDDANRALMGSNMQRQAVPLLRPDAPIVGTGMEYLAARD